jgi:hypothetical protein
MIFYRYEGVIGPNTFQTVEYFWFTDINIA